MNSKTTISPRARCLVSPGILAFAASAVASVQGLDVFYEQRILANGMAEYEINIRLAARHGLGKVCRRLV